MFLSEFGLEILEAGNLGAILVLDDGLAGLVFVILPPKCGLRAHLQFKQMLFLADNFVRKTDDLLYLRIVLRHLAHLIGKFLK